MQLFFSVVRGGNLLAQEAEWGVFFFSSPSFLIKPVLSCRSMPDAVSHI